MTVSQTADATVEVRVDSMGKAEALLVETVGGRQVVTSPGIYEYDSFGQEVRVIGSDGETTQLLQTFEPDVDSTETADILTVESDQTVQSTTGNQTFETLADAKQEADAGDIIRFESGTHVKAETVNQSLSKDVTIVAEPGTIFSCDQTKVSLRLENATMSQRSAFIQTQVCGFQPVVVPAPEGSGGSLDVLAGGDDTADTASQTETTVFDATVESDTTDGDASQPAATSDTSVTLRLSSTSEYETVTVDTQAGSQTFREPGVYTVDTYGYNATVSGATANGQTVQIDTIVAEEQDKTATKETTVDGETVNKTEIQPVDTYIVTSDGEETVADTTSNSVKKVATLSKADSLASAGDLVRIENGVHSSPETVAVTLETNVTLSLAEDASFTCEQTRISLNLGPATIAKQSKFPSVFCDEYDGVSTESVSTRINETSGDGTLIPSSVSQSWVEQDGKSDYGGAIEVQTDPAGNLYVIGQIGGETKVVKYSNAGEAVWTKNSIESPVGLNKLSNGNIEVFEGRFEQMTRYELSQSGEVVDKTSLTIPNSRSVVADAETGPNGNIYVVTENDGIIKYSSDGSLLSEGASTIETGKFVQELDIDDSGNVYITGWAREPSGSGNPNDIIVAKFNSSLSEVWNDRYDSGASDRAGAVTVSGDTVYVGGRDGTGDGGSAQYLISYTTSGERKWEAKQDLSGKDMIQSISVDQAGNIYAAGGRDYLSVIKFNQIGETQYTKTFSPSDRATGVSVTDNGDIAVVGRYNRNIVTTLYE